MQYSFGPLLAYMYSWTAIVAMKSSSAAIIAIIFGEYVSRVIVHLAGDEQQTFHKLSPTELPPLLVKSVATVSILLTFLLHAFHPLVGTRVQLIVTVMKVVLLCSIPILAIVQVAKGDMPEQSRAAMASLGSLFEGTTPNISRYALALYSGLWAYDGWDQCTFVAGEMRNPARDAARAISFSMLTVMGLFVITVFSYFVVLTPSTVVQTNSVALDFGAAVGGNVGGILFAALVALSCCGALNGHMYTYTHLAAAAGKDGFLPAAIGAVHPRFRTQLNALMLTTALALGFIFAGSGFSGLVNFSGVCTWTWYGATVLSLLVLRIKEPHLERPYRVWNSTPILFVTVAAFLLIMPIFAAPWEAFSALAFIAVSIPLYYATQGTTHDGAWQLLRGTQQSFTPVPTEPSDEIPMVPRTPV